MLPKRSVLEMIIRDALKGRIVRSQSELERIVSSRLKAVDPDYSVSGERLRRIALSMDGIMIRIITRKGRKPDACPVCGGTLKDVKGTNLAGERVTLGAECEKCSYSGSRGKWSPGRYEFWLKK